MIKSHPDFEMSTHKNNFAILFLEGTGFEAMSHIAPVCLPQVRYHQFVFKFKWSKICLSPPAMLYVQ